MAANFDAEKIFEIHKKIVSSRMAQATCNTLHDFKACRQFGDDAQQLESQLLSLLLGRAED